MSSPEKSTAFVLIPGAFCPASIYHKVTDSLSKLGFLVSECDLASVGKRDEGPASMADDVSNISHAISLLADQGKDVILVCNSYGGFPATEAAKSFGKDDRKSHGKPGGLTHIAYLASVLPPPGVTANDVVGGRVPISTTSQIDYIEPPDGSIIGPRIFGDLPEPEQQHYAKKMKCHSPLAFAGIVTHPTYLHIPSTVVVCDRDQSLPLDLQQRLLQDQLDKKSGTIRHLTLHSDHSPMVSHTEETVQILLEVIDLPR